MKLSEITTDLIMVGIVAAVIVFSGYELLHNPDGETAKTLLGAIIMTFGLITNRLFGQPPPSV